MAKGKKDRLCAIAALNERAEKHLDDDLDIDEALVCYSVALYLDPGHADTLYNLGRAYARITEYDAAIANFTAALAVAPNRADILNDRGLAYFEIDENDKAAADFEAALRIEPDNEDAKKNIELLRKEARG